jgi:hypothetical protein
MLPKAVQTVEQSLDTGNVGTALRIIQMAGLHKQGPLGEPTLGPESFGSTDPDEVEEETAEARFSARSGHRCRFGVAAWARRVVRSGRERGPGLPEQLAAGLVQADDGPRRVVGPLVDVQDVLHGSGEGRASSRHQAPLLPLIFSAPAAPSRGTRPRPLPAARAPGPASVGSSGPSLGRLLVGERDEVHLRRPVQGARADPVRAPALQRGVGPLPHEACSLRC